MLNVGTKVVFDNKNYLMYQFYHKLNLIKNFSKFVGSY